jgi:hypothetical protein
MKYQRLQVSTLRDNFWKNHLVQNRSRSWQSCHDFAVASTSSLLPAIAPLFGAIDALSY